jgi:hypothetical protein
VVVTKPAEQAHVDTISMRRSQCHLSSALSAFLAIARPTIEQIQFALP